MTDPAAGKRRATAWVSGLLVGIVIGWIMFEDAVGVVFGISIGVAFAIAFGAFDTKDDKKAAGKEEDGRDGGSG
ncbi:hypothetical protein AB0M91_05970 [Micromonospora rifamycinica]|uniref:hypothetical protein n=1 Tax=Micromonospora rifamycinica TaxID=291594 RepID=UPI0034274812